MNLKKKKGIRVSQKFWKKETLYKKDSIDKNIRIEQKSTIERKGGRKRIGSHNPSFLSSCQNLFDQVVHTRMTRVKKKREQRHARKGTLVSSCAGGIHLFTMAHENRGKRRETKANPGFETFLFLRVSPLFFQGEESVSPRDQACSMRVDPSPFTLPQPLDKATFSLCSLNHASPAYNASIFSFVPPFRWK